MNNLGSALALIVIVGALIVAVSLAVLQIRTLRQKMLDFLQASGTDTSLLDVENLPDVVGVDGMVIIAATGPQRKPLPVSNDQVVLTATSRATRRYACGHVGPQQYEVTVYGDGGYYRADMCPECMIASVPHDVTRCALCGLPIMPGSPVATYLAGREKPPPFEDKAYAINGAMLGCMRWDCCPSGGFFAGHWDGVGFVPFEVEDCGTYARVRPGTKRMEPVEAE